MEYILVSFRQYLKKRISRRSVTDCRRTEADLRQTEAISDPRKLLHKLALALGQVQIDVNSKYPEERDYHLRFIAKPEIRYPLRVTGGFV